MWRGRFEPGDSSVLAQSTYTLSNAPDALTTVYAALDERSIGIMDSEDTKKRHTGMTLPVFTLPPLYYVRTRTRREFFIGFVRPSILLFGPLDSNSTVQ